MTPGFWNGRSVLVTGHTGFKGSWLCLWLHRLGARVHGLALEPETEPNPSAAMAVRADLREVIGDVRDAVLVRRTIADFRPEIVIHMAAQPLVRAGYADPVGTYATNVMGTVHLLDAIRRVDTVRAVLVVTTDKCYEDAGWDWGYREIDRLGGHDPYSNSKACTELVAAAYRTSFFHPDRFAEHGVAVATARAGNVIGGGDWAADRLVPDVVRAFLAGERPVIRAPHAVRPWQHVLEPLSGYLSLCERLVEDGPAWGEGWNFGPRAEDARPVAAVVERMAALWGDDAGWRLDDAPQPHETHHLRLDVAKARNRLGHRPRWDLDDALARTVEWYRAFGRGEDVRSLALRQIDRFERSAPDAV